MRKIIPYLMIENLKNHTVAHIWEYLPPPPPSPGILSQNERVSLCTILLMHKSMKTPVPLPPAYSGDLTRPQPGFNECTFNGAVAPVGGGFNKMSVNRARDLTARDHQKRGRQRGFNIKEIFLKKAYTCHGESKVAFPLCLEIILKKYIHVYRECFLPTVPLC